MRPFLMAVGAVTLLVLLGGAGWIGFKLIDRPSLEAHEELFMDASASRTGEVRVTHLGTSTLLFDDGETAFITDGFFSRPGIGDIVFGGVEPDEDRIRKGLERAGVSSLAAVIVLHSHFDHVMDAPEVARVTGATLVGSPSTVNVGRGWGLPEERMESISGTTTIRAGRFVLTLIPSRHFPHGRAMGVINEPLEPPAPVSAYREGATYSLLVQHGRRRMLVQSSAGYVPGQLDDRRADVVFLGVGGLGNMDVGYNLRYWEEVVEAVEAERVFPIHWDDFTRPLEDPLKPMPMLVDDVGSTLEFLHRKSGTDTDVKMLRAWQTVDPYRGLEGAP